MNRKARGLQAATHSVTISTPFGLLRYAYTVDACSADFVLIDASPRLKSGDADGFLAVLPELLAGIGLVAGYDCGAVSRCVCEDCARGTASA
jgi:hypothetical protein